MVKRKCYKCGTKVSKEDVYCPECGVNIDQYFKDNKKTLIRGKQPEDSLMIDDDRPKIGTGTIIAIIILTFFFVIPGLIVAAIVWYNHKKAVEEWQRNKIIKNLENKESTN